MKKRIQDIALLAVTVPLLVGLFGVCWALDLTKGNGQ